MEPVIKHKSVVRWLWTALGRERLWVPLLLLVRALQGLEGTFFALELRNVIDCAVSGVGDAFLSHALVLCALVLGAMALYALGWYGEQRSRALVERRLRLHVFGQLLRRSYPHVAAVHSGEWMMRITSDTEVISNTLLSTLPGLGGLLVQMTSALFSLFLMLPQAGVLLLPAGAVLIGLSAVLRRRLKLLHKEVVRADGVSRAFMQERLTGMAIVRTFSREEQTARMAGERLDRLVDARLRRGRFAALGSLGAYCVMRGGYLLGVVLCGAQILAGRMSYGTMAAVLQLIGRIDGPIAELSDFVMKYFTMYASVERLMEIEALPPDCLEASRTPEEVQAYYRESLAAIGLRRAAFSYCESAEGRTVISNLDLEIGKGEYVAFTGESGCGKSTVLKLLMNLYPLEGGALYLRDAAGRERPLDASWRPLFAYVPQGNFLFSGTIREALTFGDRTLMAREADLWRALETACADFVRQLPAGLDTPLGERGAGLSEGQMQRISIARALLSGCPVLLLDESTSALDEGTEKELLTNLRTMTDKTVVLVTHRPAALEICEKRVEFL